MVAGDCGAKCGYSIVDPELSQGDHVHVAFDHEKAGRLRVGLTRLIEAVKLPALVKQGRFGRVQVFRPFTFEDPAPETDYAPA